MRKFILAIGCWMLTMGSLAQGTKLEAENASHQNCTVITDSKYSGGKALEVTSEYARMTFSYSATEKGKYTVYVGYDGLYGEKQVNISAGGSTNSFQVKGYQSEDAAGTYFMNQGSNSIVITPFWTWFRIDYIRIEKSSDALPFDIAAAPVDPQATASAREMYTFLYDNFGHKTVSGIMTGDMSSANGDITQHDDVKAVYQKAGKHPALVGFDFMNTTGQQEQQGWAQDYSRAVVALAKDLYQRGGLPNFTWHWRDPSRNTMEFYTDKCNMKISSALNTNGTWNTTSQLYKNIIKDIDAIADIFLELQSEGIACTFRPLHEASGGWFWWGREGAVNFVKLYHLLFDEVVSIKGVHNVIWIWNAGENDQTWNPGDSYYDIVSADIYNSDYDYSSNYVTFDKLKMLTGGKKMIALSENGPIPDIDKEIDEEAVWSWWMPWYQTWGGNFVNKTSAAEWSKCMNDPRVITLEDRSAGWNTTGIEQHQSATHTDPYCYDLQGRRVTSPKKGIYIYEGKKRKVKR